MELYNVELLLQYHLFDEMSDPMPVPKLACLGRHGTKLKDAWKAPDRASRNIQHELGARLVSPASQV